MEAKEDEEATAEVGAENTTWQKGLPNAKLNQFLDRFSKVPYIKHISSTLP